MKLDQVNKLYAKLSPKQQATLAFEAITQENAKEAEAILGSVKRQTYIGVHTEYRSHAIGLMLLAQTYALEHYRARAMLFEAYKYYGESGCTDCTFENRVHSAYLRLANLETALNRLAKEENFKPETIRKFGRCPSVKPEHLADYDEEGADEAYSLLSSSLDIG